MPNHDSKVEFYQINLHKATTPTADLNNILYRKTSFIALIQEPLFRQGKIHGLNRKKGNVIHAVGKGNPRSCIYISKDWSIQPMYQLCSRDLTVVRIKAKNVAMTWN